MYKPHAQTHPEGSYVTTPLFQFSSTHKAKTAAASAILHVKHISKMDDISCLEEHAVGGAKGQNSHSNQLSINTTPYSVES